MNRSCKRILATVLTWALLLGIMSRTVLLPVRAEGTETVTNPLAGKTISILGDSISTYTGVSNDANANATLAGGAIYYTPGKQGVYQADTWWQQVIDSLDMELCVNNSWSGSAVLPTRSGTAGGYRDRCVQLHNAAGEEPDIIAVFLGTNDFSYHQGTLGTADIDYEALITDNADGTFTYASPVTTCEAYAIMLHKMTVRYPDAEIYCMTLLPRRDPDKEDSYADVGQPTEFNAALEEVISHFGCTVVDLENCGIDKAAENFDQYITDQRVHPGPAGMDKITEALISAILGKQTKIYSISGVYTGVQTDNAAAAAAEGMGYTANIAMMAGYSDLRVTITMGGEDITDSAYDNGRIHISAVTGDIVITAAAAKTAADYRWEFSGSSVSSITTDGNKANVLTLLGGSISDGILKNAYFRMAEQVVLYHDRPWAVEWSAAGSWSGMLLSKSQTSSASGNEYFFKSNSTDIGLIAFGQRQNEQYMNYGIKLADHGVDTALRHIYRLENHIADDGSNAVRLLVDGVDYGAMTRHYISTTDQGSDKNWANGRDLTFDYIGANGHMINNCDLDYIQVWENGHTHTYESGICTGCGSAQPNYEENPWSGRSAVFVGDSITAGVGTTKLYYQFLEEKLNFGSVTAMGVAGSCISAASDYGTGNQPLINRYQDIPSADLIVIFMGTNDYGHETPLGSVEDTQDGTFYGALNTIIPALVAKHSTSKIVFVTPLHRYGFGTSKILGTQFTYDNIPNGVGAALGDYVDALKTVCANNGVSVIDLYTECTLDPSDAAVRAEYMPDGIHPNAAGHEVIAGIMESHIRGYEPVEKEPVDLPEMIQGNKFAAGNNQPCRASSRINYYLKAGTVITLKNPDVMQWACARTSNEFSSDNLGYFPDSQWTDKATAVVAEDGWIGFTFKYRDETQSFDLSKPLSDYIAIHTHTYEAAATAPTCTETGYTTHTCECGDSYVDSYVDALGHDYEAVVTEPTYTEAGYTTYTCTVCGSSYVGDHTDSLPYLKGDLDGNEVTNTDDAIYLLYHAFFGEELYPVNQPCDFDANGSVNTDDAIYLLYHAFFGEQLYPLH